MTGPRSPDAARWRRVAEADQGGGHIHPALGRYKAAAFLELVRAWAPRLHGLRLLKTDLREEAFGTDEVLFSLLQPGEEARVWALDISSPTVDRALDNARRRGLNHRYLTADVRALPLRRGSFDLVLSNSTLDHFDDGDDLQRSLAELARILTPGGKLILTLNNRHNMPLRWAWRAEQAVNPEGYPVRFYRIREAREAVTRAGLTLLRQRVIIHVPPMANSVLRLARRGLPPGWDAPVVGLTLGMARALARLPWRRYTAWFIALECQRPPCEAN